MINHIGGEVRALLRLDHLPRQPRRIRKRQLARLKAKSDAGAEAEPVCLNCGSKLEGVYCPACGQRDDDLRRPFWNFLADFGDTLFEVDSRIYLTLLPLIFMPGWVTRKYIEGKRARFVPPVRMFLVSSVVFFLVVSFADVAIMKFEFVPDDEDSNGRVNSSDTSGQAAELPTDSGTDVDYDLDVDMFVPLDEGATPIPEGVFDNLNVRAGSAELEAFIMRVVEGLKTSASDPRRLNNAFNTWIPRGMILLLPIFALFLRSLYWSRRHYLLNQVIFSLHFHTFIFLLLIFLVAAQAVWGGGVSGGLFFIVIPLYLLIAMKVVFQQGWIRTIFKFGVFSFFYMIAFWLTVFGVVIWSLYEV